MTTKAIYDAIGIGLMLIWLVTIFLPDFVDVRRAAAKRRKAEQKAQDLATLRRIENLRGGRYGL